MNTDLESAIQRAQAGCALNWHEGQALALEIGNLRARLEEVHSWIVCSAIAEAQDMMQNAARIEEVTRQEWKE